ncbi:hypothetical protein ACWZHB_00815 [Nocardia sp. FBN12]|uniref:hypothetical protein n=1 Tax=Nocardia sp. FBN12 TaxID=3419766 RepID=UPI003CFF531E
MSDRDITARIRLVATALPAVAGLTVAAVVLVAAPVDRPADRLLLVALIGVIMTAFGGLAHIVANRR